MQSKKAIILLSFLLFLAFCSIPTSQAELTSTIVLYPKKETYAQQLTQTHYAEYIPAWNASEGNYRSGEEWLLGQWNADGSFLLYRCYLSFNVIPIPDDANITEVILSLYYHADNTDVEFDLVIQNGQPERPNFPLIKSDYDRSHYAGNGGSINTVNMTLNAYNNLTFNQDGISWFNLKSGEMKFALRSNRDINGTEPTGSEWIMIKSYSIENLSPKLYVTYNYMESEEPANPWYVPPEEKPLPEEIQEIVEPVVSPLRKYGLYVIIGVMAFLTVGGAITKLSQKKVTRKPRGRTPSKIRTPRGRTSIPRGPDGRFRRRKKP